MNIKCIKDVIDPDRQNRINYKQGKEYESKVIESDILAKDEFGEFNLVGIYKKGYSDAFDNIRYGTNGIDIWFNEHFEITKKP